MTFNLENVAESLSAYLKKVLPDTNFSKGPSLQGNKFPAMFVQQKFASMKLRQGGRMLQTIGFDLTYLLQYNIENRQALYEAAAAKLDGVMETFPYTDESGAETLLRTYEREWQIDPNALHYKFELRVWLEPEPDGSPMMEGIAADIAVTDKKE